MDRLRARGSAPGRSGLIQDFPLHGRIVPMPNSSSAVSDSKMPPECDDLIGTPKHLVLRTPTTMTGRVIVETGSSEAVAAVLVIGGVGLTALEPRLDAWMAPQHIQRLRSWWRHHSAPTLFRYLLPSRASHACIQVWRALPAWC